MEIQGEERHAVAHHTYIRSHCGFAQPVAGDTGLAVAGRAQDLAWRWRQCSASPPNARPCKLRSEEHTSELQSLMRISYAVFCLKKTQTQTYTILHPANTTNHTLRQSR